MSYRQYFKYFRFGRKKAGPNYYDGRGKSVCQRAHGKEALIRTKEIKVTKSEDAFMHLLMLNHPWRTDVDEWIGVGKIHSCYQTLAVELLGREMIRDLAEGLLVVLDYGIVYDNPLRHDGHDVGKDIEWTEDQKNVIRLVRARLETQRECLLLVTGAAGTGKSTVLEEVCRIAKHEKFEPIRLAPSGVAAVNIKGSTLHSWFRLTKAERPAPEGNSYAIREQLMDIADRGLMPLFLVDEVSMISATLFSTISRALQEAAYADMGKPFGGFPVVLFGDFGQLGPIGKKFGETDWIWKSDVYERFERVDLCEPCRQSGDAGFSSMLDDIRRGNFTPEMVSVFAEICGHSEEIPEDAIHLYPFKKAVEEYNLKRLQSLHGDNWYSIAYDNAGITEDATKREAIEAETGLLSVLWLKIGARVMCTSNVDVAGGIVNGTTGEVVRLCGQHVVQVKEDLTGRVFNIQQECRRTRFNGQERRQFPLIPAWALTIHKCQSLTLNKVVVNVRDVFACGQAYVAMSRVRTRHDLFINSWSESILSVKHAVKTRLTKDSEAARTEKDEEIDRLEENPEYESEGSVPESSWKSGLKELRLRGWDDYSRSSEEGLLSLDVCSSSIDQETAPGYWTLNSVSKVVKEEVDGEPGVRGRNAVEEQALGRPECNVNSNVGVTGTREGTKVDVVEPEVMGDVFPIVKYVGNCSRSAPSKKRIFSEVDDVGYLAVSRRSKKGRAIPSRKRTRQGSVNDTEIEEESDGVREGGSTASSRRFDCNESRKRKRQKLTDLSNGLE